MKLTEITDDTPVSFLTVGQLRDVLKSINTDNQPAYVKGIAGMMRLFNCSATTAMRIKSSGVIDLAIRQTKRGGAFYVDADLALKIYNRNLRVIDNE